MDHPAIHQAASDNNLARLRALLATGVDVDARDLRNDSTALHHAAYGRTACLEALLAAGASVHSTNAGRGNTPLQGASESGHAACVRALIAAGSDVNFVDRDGRMPFSYALRYGNRRVLKILLRAGADVDTRGALPTHPAVSNTDAWALVDAIRKVGDWSSYVRRRRAICASVIEKAITRDALPHDINLEIAAFVEPPGGY